MKAYHNAIKISESSSDYENKISAFNNVIGFCSNDMHCLNDNSRKRDMILYWTYNNLGDIFLEFATKKNQKNFYANAIENYQRALNFSRNKKEKLDTLKRLSQLYNQSGDINNFYTVQDTIIEADDVEKKREAFENLSEKSEETASKIYFLEKALDYIRYEKVSAFRRCENTVRICEKLRSLYAKNKDYGNLARIEELRSNTLLLMH